MDVIEKNDLKDNCICLEGNLNEETGYELTKRALEMDPNLEGMVFANHIHARMGIKYLIERGMIPGQDISVSIVGAPKWATSGLNDFTCVDLNGPLIGKRAAKLMLSIIKGEIAENKFVNEYVPCKLNHGRSIVI